MVIPSTPFIKKGDTLTLHAASYNEKKTTSYRLPRDIVFTYDETPRAVMVSAVGDPRDAKFSVEMYGYPSLAPDDIRWYVKNTPGSCYFSKNPESPERPWSANEYKKVTAERISISTK